MTKHRAHHHDIHNRKAIDLMSQWPISAMDLDFVRRALALGLAPEIVKEKVLRYARSEVRRPPRFVA